MDLLASKSSILCHFCKLKILIYWPSMGGFCLMGEMNIIVLFFLSMPNGN
jgi:hypothetical protein